MAVEAAQVEQHLLDLFLRPMAEELAEEERKARQSQALGVLVDIKEI
jgi:hypothetical protein